jgi:hypothetical protein
VSLIKTSKDLKMLLAAVARLAEELTLETLLTLRWKSPIYAQRAHGDQHYPLWNIRVYSCKQNKKDDDDDDDDYDDSIIYYLCAEPTASRPITNTAQCRYK